jgi:hypothetical protein
MSNTVANANIEHGAAPDWKTPFGEFAEWSETRSPPTVIFTTLAAITARWGSFTLLFT